MTSMSRWSTQSNLWSSTFLDLLNFSDCDHTKDIVYKFSCVLNTAHSLSFTPTATYYKSHPFFLSPPSQSLIPPPEFRSLSSTTMVPHMITCLYYISQSFPLKDKPLSEIVCAQAFKREFKHFSMAKKTLQDSQLNPSLTFADKVPLIT